MSEQRRIDYRIWIALGVLGFFLLISLYAAEIPYFSRYLSFAEVLIFGVSFGILLGSIAGIFWGKKLTDPYDRLRLRIGLMFAGLIFGPLFFSLLNRHLDPWPAQVETVEFFDLDYRYSSRFGLPDTGEMPDPNSSHLYFYRNSELKRIIFNKKLDLGDLERGDAIGLQIRPGLFGVAWVKSVYSEDGGLDRI